MGQTAPDSAGLPAGLGALRWQGRPTSRAKGSREGGKAAKGGRVMELSHRSRAPQAWRAWKRQRDARVSPPTILRNQHVRAGRRRCRGHDAGAPSTRRSTSSRPRTRLTRPAPPRGVGEAIAKQLVAKGVRRSSRSDGRHDHGRVKPSPRSPGSRWSSISTRGLDPTRIRLGRRFEHGDHTSTTESQERIIHINRVARS